MTPVVKLLMMGDPGSGKTTCVGHTFPEPVLFLNFDRGGTESITKRKLTNLTAAELEDVCSGKTKAEGVMVRDYFSEQQSVSLTLFRNPDGNVLSHFLVDINRLMKANKFATICIDSFTRMDEAIMDFVLGAQGKKSPELQHYKFQQDKKHELLTTILANVERMPGLKAFVVIAHVEVVKIEALGEVRILPTGVGAKYQQTVAGLFSQVVFATTEPALSGQKFVAWTQPKNFVKGLKLRGYSKPSTVELSWQALFGD